MATYNALLSLGMDLGTEDVADLIVPFEKEGSAAFGLLGTSPWEVYNYFKEQDYETVLSFNMGKEEINQIGEQYDTVIITVYNTSNDLGDQIHTVNIQKLEDGTFLAHNSARAVPWLSLWEVITHMSQGDVSPISIIGISNPEGESLKDEEG